MNSALLAWFLKLQFLDGYRTYIAAAGSFSLGIYRLTQGDYEGGIASISLALGMIGIRDQAPPPTTVIVTGPPSP